jgi:hypothetical protein
MTENETWLAPPQIPDHIGLGEYIVETLCTDGLITTRRTRHHVQRGSPLEPANVSLHIGRFSQAFHPFTQFGQQLEEFIDDIGNGLSQKVHPTA